MKVLATTEAVDEILRSPVAVVFKHSPRCSVSALAHREAEKFLKAHPDREVHLVPVIESRPVSDYLERVLGVKHASPQVIVLRDGNVVWHGSHFGVTAEAIAAALL